MADNDKLNDLLNNIKKSVEEYDSAHEETEKQLAELEKKIKDVYRQASEEMQIAVHEYYNSFSAIDKKQQQAVKDGKITKKEYKEWRETAFLRGGSYEKMQKALAENIYKADKIAIAYINDNSPSIYSLNHDFMNDEIAGAYEQLSFNIYDAQTVKNLIMNDSNLMPYYPEKRAINRGIDLDYSKKQIRSSILSGILQGKTLGEMVNDLQKRMESMGRTSAIRAARTAFTNAENAGRMASFQNALKMGIDIRKEWMSTPDSRTRDAHREVDGQVVDVDECFIVGGEKMMFPGDGSNGASGWNLYNCRCTIVANFDNMEDLNTENVNKEDENENIEYIRLNTRNVNEYLLESYNDWYKKLTIDEKNAVMAYTGSLYKSLNPYLRGKEWDHYEWSTYELKEYSKNIQTALAKFELKENIIVTRGMRGNRLANLEVGDVFYDKGYASTTIKEEGAGFGANTIEIQIPAGVGIGAYIQPLSNYEEEYEFLLMKNSAIEILSKETSINDYGETVTHLVGRLIVE